MAHVIRFGVSLDDRLLGEFDRSIAQKHYTNRSEAVRDLIRDALVSRQWDENRETVGTITLVYDHHIPDLTEKLTEIQHRHHQIVLSAMHVHLDHDHCLEVLVVRGRGKELQQVADRLIATKGVKHGKLTMTTTGKGLR